MSYYYCMALSPEDIRKIATLAKLPINEEEANKYSSEISHILSYMEILQEVDISHTPPTSQVTGLTNVTHSEENPDHAFSEDISKNTLHSSQNSIEANQIKIPNVL